VRAVLKYSAKRKKAPAHHAVAPRRRKSLKPRKGGSAPRRRPAAQKKLKPTPSRRAAEKAETQDRP